MAPPNPSQPDPDATTGSCSPHVPLLAFLKLPRVVLVVVSKPANPARSEQPLLPV